MCNIVLLHVFNFLHSQVGKGTFVRIQNKDTHTHSPRTQFINHCILISLLYLSKETKCLTEYSIVLRLIWTRVIWPYSTIHNITCVIRVYSMPTTTYACRSTYSFRVHKRIVGQFINRISTINKSPGQCEIGVNCVFRVCVSKCALQYSGKVCMCGILCVWPHTFVSYIH